MSGGLPRDADIGWVADVGGVLLDLRPIHERAWTEALADAGLLDATTLSHVEMLLRDGVESDCIAHAICPSDPCRARALAVKKRRIATRSRTARPARGAREWLARLPLGVNVVGITNGQADWTRLLLADTGLLDRLRCVLGRETLDAAVSKADLLRRATAVLRERIPTVIFVGDTPFDERIAAEAGVPFRWARDVLGTP